MLGDIIDRTGGNDGTGHYFGVRGVADRVRSVRPLVSGSQYGDDAMPIRRIDSYFWIRDIIGGIVLDGYIVVGGGNLVAF